MSDDTTDVLIIGGGIQGCATAWNLAKAGIDCVVLEKDYPGRHASGVNAGGVRRLGRHLAELPLSQRASEIWPHLDEWLEADTGFHASRQIKVAESDRDLETLSKRAQSVRDLGFNHEEMIDRHQLRELLPAVAEHCTGGLLVEGDGSAIPYKATTAFTRAAIRSGARFYPGSEVTAISRCGEGWQVTTAERSLQCRTLINCAGAWGDKIAALVGDRLPLEPVALMLMISERMPHFVDGVVGSASRALSFKQFDNGTVLIGGGHRGLVDRDTNRADIRTEGLAISAQTACELFPIMRKARLVRSWAGIEGFTPDDIPILGYGSAPNVIHAFGFCGHGFQLGPVIGETLAQLVQNGRSALPIDAFNPARFALYRADTSRRAG